MAVDVVSPRISFSYDLREADFVAVESHNPQSDIDFIDFDFSIGDNFSLELSSADELFANGKILPVEVKKFKPTKDIYQSEPTEPNPSTDSHKIVEKANEDTVTKKKTLIEFLSDACDEEEKPPTKPFWQFRRSISLNSDNGLLRSLKFLSRSNSTGSTLNPNPNPKPSALPKVIQKQNSMKDPPTRSKYSSTNSSLSGQNYSNIAPKRPPLNRSTSTSYGNGVHINPVLNLSPTYIAKGTVTLFGLGSLFCNGKSKKKKR
ncbi:Hypothetical predicted protein [Olea europaea subsp. europaea]|uniref:Uncharacterized protein n=1 Tax=Olea europaea subsp. europaea TaxID=158383 RepID=A0A8S0S1U0_OLEEU|nr:Hypothetical predicted protein [Olea europaea subsp. europaea]